MKKLEETLKEIEDTNGYERIRASSESIAKALTDKFYILEKENWEEKLKGCHEIRMNINKKWDDESDRSYQFVKAIISMLEEEV